VVVIDANFPKEAGDVLQAIRKTTDKPVRYVLDTHHHGDHAYGNAVWVKEGATIVGQRRCFELLRTTGPEEFKKAGEGPQGRKDVAGSVLKAPTLVFDDKLVLDDGKQRVEFLFLGHAHTPGDAVAYLPHHKILCTGDACVNGAFNYTGHSDSASWIKVLDRMKQLDVKYVCPGHGPVTTKGVFDKQQRYFQDMRRLIKAGIDDRKTLDDITASIDLPWYKEWTGKEAKLNKENIEHIYKELTGQITATDLIEELGRTAGKGYCKATPGWSPPRRILIPNLSPARVAELKRVAPDVEFVPARTLEEAILLVRDADAAIGFCSEVLIDSGKKLHWIQTAGEVQTDLQKQMETRGITMTTVQAMPPAEVDDRPWRILRENVRRFAAGEPLLGVLEIRTN
jgi:glyoxylase-like metal-dependent hydrolase (beta-lactamase superfamily II)